jgi:hypothetical protein
LSEYAEKLRSLGFARRRGSSERKPVVNEDDGKIGGYHIEHWDDSQDAEVHPRALRLKLSKEELRERSGDPGTRAAGC